MATNKEMSEETRRRITDTFWTMALDEGLGRVTVWSLMKRVGMNRSTFYEYFDGIEDLLRQSEEELLADLGAEARRISAGDSEDRYPPNILARLFPVYGGKMMMLLGAEGDPEFFGRLKTTLKPVLCEFYGLDETDEDGDRILEFILSLGIGVLTKNARTGCGEEELMRELMDTQRLAFYGISRYSRNDPFEGRRGGP